MGMLNDLNEENKIMLEIKNLYKAFGSNEVLVNFNLTLHEGENIVVLGKSGSGKSVLIKCVIGLMLPDKGEILAFGDNNISNLNQEELDRIRAKIGFLFQSNALYDSMTVRENLLFPMRRHWIDTAEVDETTLILEALSNVGLEHTIDMMPIELSGGMRKRIALARTLILKPKIMLYDEPTTGLDPITAREISHLMVDLQEKYKTSSLIITHDLSCVRITSDKVAMLIDGTCYAFDTYEALQKSKDPRIMEFFE